MKTNMIFLFAQNGWLADNPWVFWAAGAVLFMLLAKTFLGWVFIKEEENGIVIKKWGLGAASRLQEGRIIATKGEAGIQAKMLEPGLHFWKWWWMFSIKKQPITNINHGSIGVIEAIDGKPIPQGAILVGNVVECNMYQDAVAFLDDGGQKGFQRNVLTVGSYRINTELFKVLTAEMIEIPADKIGLVTTLDGVPLEEGMIAGPIVKEDHKYFQDANTFLDACGQRGMQEQVLRPGKYYINPKFAKVDIMEMTEVPIGYVGVVNSFIGEDGEDVSGDDFKHGNIVKKGQKGIWNWTYDPGLYPVNTRLMKVELVPTTNIVLNWDAEMVDEVYQFDKELKTIQVKSKDGFEFEVNIAQIINISDKSAPKVIARFGSVKNLIAQVLEPTISNYVRNSAQTTEALEFVYGRENVEAKARQHIAEILQRYDIEAVDTLIGDVKPPDDLMKILKEQKVAEKQKDMYLRQKESEEKRQEQVKAKTAADKEAQLTAAAYDKDIAKQNAEEQVVRAGGERDSKKILAEGIAFEYETVGAAEGKKILAVGNAEAEVIQKKTEAMDKDKFALVETAKALAAGGIQIVPKVIAGGEGGSSGFVEALIGAQLLKEGVLSDEEKTPRGGAGGAENLAAEIVKTVEKTDTVIDKDDLSKKKDRGKKSEEKSGSVSEE